MKKRNNLFKNQEKRKYLAIEPHETIHFKFKIINFIRGVKETIVGGF